MPLRPPFTAVVLALTGIHGATASNAGVAACDAEDPAQSWSLRLKGSWGESATLVNIAGAEPQCLDVAGRSTGAGVIIRSWRCCCAGLKTTAGKDVCGHHPCGDIKDNYNQVYELSHGHLTTGRTMGEKCLSLTSGGEIKTEACTTSSTKWVYSAAQQPPLRLAANMSMCLTAGDARSPSPAPDPEGPVIPVPQACTAANTTSLPFCDRSLAAPARVKDLLGRLTLDEKLTQLIGGIGGGITPGIRDLFPPYQYHSEGLHGLRSTCGLGSHGPAKNHTALYSTLFPQVTAMAATGNLALVKTMAAHMAAEARAVNNYMEGNTVGKGGGLDYWGPTINVARDPREITRATASQYCLLAPCISLTGSVIAAAQDGGESRSPCRRTHSSTAATPRNSWRASRARATVSATPKPPHAANTSTLTRSRARTGSRVTTSTPSCRSAISTRPSYPASRRVLRRSLSK